MVTVVVTGGRTFDDVDFAFLTLDIVHARLGITKLVQGGATGLDQLAEQWAVLRGVPCATYPANWERYGHRAGRVRNMEMLTKEKPKLVVRFPGGRGTTHMHTIALNARVPVLDACKFWHGQYVA